MQFCKCGAVIPLEACPTCPPQIWTCPQCGEETLVEASPEEQYADVIKRFKERQNKVIQNE